MGFKSENIVFTDVGVHLKSGFKKILCSHMLVFTLILDSQKYCVHLFFLYFTIGCTALHWSVLKHFSSIVYCTEAECLAWKYKSHFRVCSEGDNSKKPTVVLLQYFSSSLAKKLCFCVNFHQMFDACIST